MSTQGAIDALDAADELAERAAETRRDLRRSLAIKELWPEAFDVRGGVTSQIVGNNNKELTFTIKRKDGKKRAFDLLDVPFCLWCEQVKAAIRKGRIGNGPAIRYYNKLIQHEGD
jgi:hypothetical protein